MKYNKEKDRQEGEINIRGKKVKILIYGEYENENINDVVKRCVLKIEANWEKFNSSILENLYSLYNDIWRKDDKSELSESDFLDSMVIDSVHIEKQDDNEDDAVCIYYNDSGLFGGQFIEIFIDSDCIIYDAELIS